MEVILLDDVEHVGLRGEVVSVARGYARNYLLPRRLAEEATTARVTELRKRDADRARHEAKTAEQAQGVADTLSKTVLRFEVKAGPTGALFGSVTPTDIADEIWRTRKIRIDRRKIDIGTIKRIGRYDIPIDVFQDVRAELKALVVPEGGELPSDEELAAMEQAERAEESADTAEPDVDLEAIIAEEDAAEAASAAEEPEPADEQEAEAEPEWRADADAALRDE
jgi:large subunit ribosomal protein L9